MGHWAQLLITIVAAIIGYIFGVSRDRSNALRSKKLEAVARLHERVLEIEGKELSNGKSRTFAVSIVGRAKVEGGQMSEADANYLSMLSQWRQDLYEEESKARLWIDQHTVDLVGSYLVVLMQCQSWEKFGKGKLIEDETFVSRLKSIFGNTERVLNKVTIRHSKTGEPWLIDCVLLSHMCLNKIHRRVRLELSSPNLFLLSRIWHRLTNRKTK